jgi:hypothetical protein
LDEISAELRQLAELEQVNKYDEDKKLAAQVAQDLINSENEKRTTYILQEQENFLKLLKGLIEDTLTKITAEFEKDKEDDEDDEDARLAAKWAKELSEGK